MDMTPSIVSPAYDYVLSVLDELSPPQGRILDYGCGSGHLVRAGRERGLNILGTDIFYGGSLAKREAANQLGSTIFEMPDGRIPFPDKYFDTVFANQVFEHVEDMPFALDEIRRVLKPGGAFLNIFPSIGVFREGHVGVLFAHWLNRAPTMQRLWLRAAFALGAGYHRNAETGQLWSKRQSEWLRNFTVYRSARAVRTLHAKRFATARYLEPEMVAHRCRSAGLPYRWCGTAIGSSIATVLARRLATMVIELR